MKRVLAAGLLIGVGFMAWARPLEVWQSITFAEGFNEALRTRVLEWAKKTGNEVNLVMMPDKIFNEKLIHAIETGITPDVALVVEYGDALAYAAGLLVPLDDLVDRLGRDDFWPEALQAMALPDPITGELRIWGLPLIIEPFYWHIRVDLLEAAGIEIPKYPTWDWLLQAAYAVNKPPEIYGLAITLGGGMDAPTILYYLVALYGGGFVTEISPTGADIFNTEPTWRLFDDLKRWWKDGIIPPDSVAWGDIDNNLAFMEGRAFAIHNPTTVLATMVRLNNPLLPGTGVVNIPPVIEAKESVLVFKSDPQREALAKDLLYYIFSDKEKLRITISDEAGMYGMPIFKSQADVFSRMIAEKTGVYRYAMHDLVEPIRRGEFYMWCNTIPFPYGKAHPAWEAIWGAGEIPKFLTDLVLRDRDSRAVAAAMAAWMNSILAKWAK
jgi:ABC-type glycerol-3-phosphate transport system substrate-binding protein